MKGARGFTTVELIVVMVLIGIIAAIGIPKLLSDNTVAASAFGNHMVSAMRLASHRAVAHRRLVCTTINADNIDFRMAAAPGAVACDSSLSGIYAPDYRTDNGNIRMTGALVGTTLFFRPDGTFHTAGGGAAPVVGAIGIQADGKNVRTIALRGETGYVE